VKGHDRRESVHLGSVWCVCSSAHVTILCDSSVLPPPSFLLSILASFLPFFRPSYLPAFRASTRPSCPLLSVYGG
jgi:hypothetical protein